MRPLVLEADEERLAFGKLLDSPRRLAELGGDGLRVGDDRQDIAVFGGDLQPPAADERLIAVAISAIGI